MGYPMHIVMCSLGTKSASQQPPATNGMGQETDTQGKCDSAPRSPCLYPAENRPKSGPSPPQAGSDHSRSRNLSNCSFIPRGTSTLEGHRAQRSQSICPSTAEIHLADHSGAASGGEISRKTFRLIKKTIDFSQRETNRAICLPTTS